VRGRGGDDRQARFLGEQGQRVVAFIGEWVQGVGQFDNDVVPPEPVDQVGQRASRRVEPARQRCAYRALAASGEYQPMTVS
jgi:hypothetical protein